MDLLRRSAFGLLFPLLLLTGCQTESDQPEAGDHQVDEYRFRLVVDPEAARVPSLMAGANYLAPSDRLQGTFGARAESLGVTLLRWPGGELAETWEDYLQAYISHADTKDWSSFQHDAPWSLAAFLDWTDGRGIEPTIVLPVKRYVDGSGQIDLERMGAELGAFVHEVTTGRFGSRRVGIWEIGNEFFWSSNKISEEIYAEIAAYLLPILHANAAYPIKIGIQGGRLGDGRISRVASGFTAREKDQVGFLIDHIYARNFDFTNYLDRFRLYQINWGDKPVYISEWNQKSDSDADPSVYAWGIEQPAPMLRIWDAMTDNNVEYAAFWAVQQNNQTSAFPKEGKTPDQPPYIGGVMFSWLATTLGMERLQSQQIGRDGLFLRAYRNGPDLTIFAAGLEEGRQQVYVDIPGYLIHDIQATRMSGERDIRNQEPQLHGMSPHIGQNGISFTINTRSDQEMIYMRMRGQWDAGAATIR